MGRCERCEPAQEDMQPKEDKQLALLSAIFFWGRWSHPDEKKYDPKLGPQNEHIQHERKVSTGDYWGFLELGPQSTPWWPGIDSATLWSSQVRFEDVWNMGFYTDGGTPIAGQKKKWLENPSQKLDDGTRGSLTFRTSVWLANSWPREFLQELGPGMASLIPASHCETCGTLRDVWAGWPQRVG